MFLSRNPVFLSRNHQRDCTDLLTFAAFVFFIVRHAGSSVDFFDTSVNFFDSQHHRPQPVNPAAQPFSTFGTIMAQKRI